MSLNMKTLSLTLLSSAALFAAACSPTDSDTEEQALVDGDEIELVYVAWDTELASTNVIGRVLSEVGYDVTLTSVDNAFMWEAIANNESDAMVSGWLPTSHGPNYEEHGDEIDHLGTNLEGAQVGFVVPEYMEDINEIEDLDDQVNQTIVGIERGAGTVESAEVAIEEYDNMDGWEVHASSSGAMVTELQNAIDNEEDIVVTGWTPHWKFQRFDVKMLDDPQNSFGETETIETFSRQGLEEDHPVAYSILENFYWEQEDIESVMLDIQDGLSPEDAAESWIEENQEAVDEWTAEAEEMATE